MAHIIKLYCEDAPASRFIGIRYGERDRMAGGFAHLWHQWMAQQQFARLTLLLDSEWAARFPEAGSYIGFMRYAPGKPFEYWIGLFLPPATQPPQGFDHLDAPAMRLGVCWVQGKEPEIFWQSDACLKKLAEAGESPAADGDGYHWLMERYQSPRYTTTDMQGHKVLDQVVVLK